MKNSIVIKLGGSALQNAPVLSELAKLVQGYCDLNYDVVVVHGGGPAINKELTAKGISWSFINGQRQTTPEMVSIIEDVLAHKINSFLVRALEKNKVAAKGVSGATANLLFCSQLSSELMQVGKIENVNLAPIQECFFETKGAVPVVAPIGIGAGGEKYNINADWAAAKIAMALKADALIFLTDQKGILNNKNEIMAWVTPDIINSCVADGSISGGMYTKVMTMVEALYSGVQNVRVLHAMNASDILFSDDVGTLLHLNDNVVRQKENENVQFRQ